MAQTLECEKMTWVRCKNKDCENWNGFRTDKEGDCGRRILVVDKQGKCMPHEVRRNE